MKLVKVILGGLMLAAAPLAALAEDMSYSYVDLAYVDTGVDGVGPSLDGFALRGSVGFAENWFAFAEYAAQSVSGVDLDTFAVGLGGHYRTRRQPRPRGPHRLDQGRDQLRPVDVDDDGYLVDAGLRGRVGDAVELEGGARYTDFSDGGDATGLFVGGRFHFNEPGRSVPSTRTATTVGDPRVRARELLKPALRRGGREASSRPLFFARRLRTARAGLAVSCPHARHDRRPRRQPRHAGCADARGRAALPRGIPVRPARRRPAADSVADRPAHLHPAVPARPQRPRLPAGLDAGGVAAAHRHRGADARARAAGSRHTRPSRPRSRWA